METLVWTRGRAFPLSRLESRLRCRQCGSRQIVVLFEPPANLLQQTAVTDSGKGLPNCQFAFAALSDIKRLRAGIGADPRNMDEPFDSGSLRPELPPVGQT